MGLYLGRRSRRKRLRRQRQTQSHLQSLLAGAGQSPRSSAGRSGPDPPPPANQRTRRLRDAPGQAPHNPPKPSPDTANPRRVPARRDDVVPEDLNETRLPPGIEDPDPQPATSCGGIAYVPVPEVPVPTGPSREERLARDARRERARSALAGAAQAYGMYVFEALMTSEDGQIDFLLVGSDGLTVVVLRDDKGQVTDSPGEILTIDGHPFADDPYEQASDLADDVERQFGDRFNVYDLICFTNARLFGPEHPPENYEPRTCTIWGLMPDMAPIDDLEDGDHLTPADVADLADEVQARYGRPPLATPDTGDL